MSRAHNTQNTPYYDINYSRLPLTPILTFPQPLAPPTTTTTAVAAAAAATACPRESSVLSNLLPAVPLNPTKKRRRQATEVHKRSDEEVWSMDDDKIIDASLQSWRSSVYDHYSVRIERDVRKQTISFVFSCAFKNPSHKTVIRARAKTSEGTSNLKKTADACDMQRGLHTAANKTISSTIPYSYGSHRTLLALRCATSNRPFSIVNDRYYKLEVDMLRPGTSVPSAATVSNDINEIYVGLSRNVRNYFELRNRPVHLAVDGWTAPTSVAYLGVVIIWPDAGRIYRVILELIRLTDRHTGKYLATELAACLKRFGLENHLHTICMDNAANCNTTASELAAIIPAFRGIKSRTRCIAHIVNLIAKATMSLFFKPPKAKKAVKITSAPAHSLRSDTSTVQGEVILDFEGVLSEEEKELASVLWEDEDENANLDNGQGLHDIKIMATCRTRALDEMAAMGISVTTQELKSAELVLTKIAGLAKKVHDTPLLQHQLEKYIEEEMTNPLSPIDGSKRSLTRRVPTRWNSDLDCLISFYQLRTAVEKLIGQSMLKLDSFRLSSEQNHVAQELMEILLIFREPTLQFSQAAVPLIADVLPMLLDVQNGLEKARDSEIPSVLRVAAHAGVLTCKKYFSLSDECEVYWIAIVLSLDKKLRWFSEKLYSAQDIMNIRNRVVSRWVESYQQYQHVVSSNIGYNAPPLRSRYLPRTESIENVTTDSICAYLDSPSIPTSAIKAAGGLLAYWLALEQTHPSLARMAMDFCSAPASSVDVERAFSVGRRQINFMQHNISSQSFRAQMAVGSWDGTPLFSNINDAIDIVTKKMSHANTQ